MPAINDLSPEEEAAFASHGVESSGPGMEPTGEPSPGQEAAPVAEAPAGPQRDESGRFVPAAEPAAPAQTDASPPSGFVPHAAMHAERVRAQQAMQREQLITTRMNAMLAAQQQTQAPAGPSLAEDPVAYIQNLEARLQQFEQTRQEETQFRQIDQALEQDEQLFSQQVPDYDKASEHYVRSRAQELLAFHSPQDAQRIMMQEARQIAQQAWQRGIPAAQAVYQLSQARGYAPAAAPQTMQRVSPASAVAAAAAGQQATRTLSGSSGAPTTMNAEAIVNMSDAEFERYIGLGKTGANERFRAALG